MITRIYKGTIGDDDGPGLPPPLPATNGKAPRGKFSRDDEDEDENEDDDEDEDEDDDADTGVSDRKVAPRRSGPPSMVKPPINLPPPTVKKALPVLGALASSAGRAVAGAAASGLASSAGKKEDTTMKGKAPRGPATDDDRGAKHKEPDGDEDESGNEPNGPEEKGKAMTPPPAKGLAPRGL